jgi:hypothetical protein
VRDEKKRKLEAAGWQVGDTREYLGLTADEAAFVGIKLDEITRCIDRLSAC